MPDDWLVGPQINFVLNGKARKMEEKQGLFKRLKQGLTKTRDNIVHGIDTLFLGYDKLDDDFYEFDDKNMLVFGKRTRKTYRLGDRVLVYVAKVDRMMGTIDFMFEDDFETFED